MKKRKKLLALLAVILVFFVSLVLIKYTRSYAIYRDVLDTKVYLSVLDPSANIEVSFNTHGGEEVDSMRVEPNTQIGVLPKTTKTGYNFVGWYTQENGGDKLTPNTVITAPITYHAHWVKIVCKKATVKHTETCATGGGCLKLGFAVGDTIEYGNLPDDDSPVPGDAYDCDVNNDGTYNATNERFYYVRSKDNGENGVLVHYTSFDENGQMDSSTSRKNYVYEEGKSYLPDNTVWTNPALATIDGRVSRYISHDDLKTACGNPIVYDKASYFSDCYYFLETTRFQSSNLGRSGLWVEKLEDTVHRIQTSTVAIEIPQANPSSNTVRPVIEIPTNTIDGYVERVAYNVTFDTHGGDPVAPYVVYEGKKVGTLPQTAKEGYNFAGWYTNTSYTTEVTADTIINGNVTFHAKWEEKIDNLEYVFHIPGRCDFGGSSANITSSTNDCISTINTTGSDIDYTASANKYIDTKISLYNQDNYEKDYEIGFTINAYRDSDNTTKQTSIMSVKAENTAANYPGIVFRKFDTSNGVFQIDQKIKGVQGHVDDLAFNNPITDEHPIKVIIERKGGVVSYSYDGGPMTELQTITETDYFNIPVWFGAASNTASVNAYTANARRYLKGTLSNMYIKLEAEGVVKYTVTFDTHGGTADFTSKEVKQGNPVGTLPVAEKPGYAFDGWYTQDVGGTKIDKNTVVTADITYHAHYKDIYLVTFEGGDGTVSINPNTIEVADGESIGTNNLPTADYADHYFDGWYTLSTGGTKIDGTETISQDVTYYAQYKNLYYVTFNGHGGTVDVTPNPVPVADGDSIGTLPTASKSGAMFDGWYTAETGGVKVDGTEPITGNVEYHARYVTSCTVTFEGNGGTPYFHSKEVAYGDVIGELPTAENTDITLELEGWYTDLNDPTTKANETSTTITSNVIYYAKWVTTTKVAVVGVTRYDTLQEAITAVPNTGVKTTVYLLNNTAEKVTVNDGRDVLLDLNQKTVSHPNDNSNAQVFTVEGGSLELINGTVTSNKASGMINVNTGGTLTINTGAVLNMTGTRQAIYVNAGTLYVYDGTIQNKEQRGTIHVLGNGTATITGGTITSTNAYALYNEKGTMIIGKKDGTLDITKPVIQGKTYGVVAKEQVKFYDGIIKGQTAVFGKTTNGGTTPTISVDTNETMINDIESGTKKVSGTDGNYNTLYLEFESNKYQITFDSRGGTVSPTSKPVEPGDEVGSLPTPNKGAYTFEGWYDIDTDQQVDEHTIPTKSTTYYAVYSFTPEHDTFNLINDPMRVYYNGISTWKNNETTYLTNMENNFNSYNCLSCDANPSSPYQSCPATGEVQCDRPKGYETGVQGILNVYTSDAVNKQKGTLVTYTSVTENGTIYDMIPGNTYYWELDSDPNIYGTVTVSGERRILEAGGVRNIRDLGGLQVDTNNDGVVDGTIDYGRMYRGPKLNSTADVASLQKLGITEEIDLRGSSNDSKLSNYVPRQIVNYEVDKEHYASNYNALRNALTATMEDVINGENIYFHCAIGTDRTGTMAYFLEGLLGVSEEDRLQDYELSYFYGLLNRHRFYRNQPGSSITHRFEYMHNLYPTNQDIYNYYVTDSDPAVQAANAQRVENFRAALIH